MTGNYDFANSITAPDYENNKPFPWTKLDGLDLIPTEWLDDLAAAAKDALRNPNVWHRYKNPIESKLVATNDIRSERVFCEIVEKLHSPDWLKSLADLTGIEGLQPDESLYGAGLSVVPSGGYLGLHKDLQVHPEWQTKPVMERRLNLALFLNREWQDDWGGHLELWSECSHGKPLKCAKRIRPQFSRIVLFDPNGFHGFADPIACPPDVFRLSLQLFYYAPMRAATAVNGARKHAWFELRPGEDPAKVINDFRYVGRSKP